MTIHAYTEATGPLPAYINLSERVAPRDVIITVRSRGENNGSSIFLGPAQQRNLFADLQAYLAANGDIQIGDVVQLKSGGPNMTVESMGAGGDVNCAWSTDDNNGIARTQFPAACLRKKDVQAKAPAAQETAPASVAPDVNAMVNRFLGWPLPRTFGPDCGISFDGRKDDEWNKNKSWPIGTNLLTAVEAKAMFEHCLSDK